MSRFKFPVLLSLALAAFAWTTAPALAAGRGGGGRSGGGRSGGGSRSGGFARGGGIARSGGFARGGGIGRSASFARGGYGYARNGYGYARGGYGYGLGGYGYGRGGYGYGLGGYGYGLGGYGLGLGSYGYGLGGYGYGGYYPSYGYDYGPPAYGYPEPQTTINTQQSAYYAPLTDNSAGVHIRVPSDATVWVEDVRTQKTGPERDFVSPPLKPGTTFEYEIKARWMENGKPVQQMRTVKVRANETSNVDFLSRTTR
jgi:uncharacterized protein (TIGR03000 family)